MHAKDLHQLPRQDLLDDGGGDAEDNDAVQGLSCFVVFLGEPVLWTAHLEIELSLGVVVPSSHPTMLPRVNCVTAFACEWSIVSAMCSLLDSCAAGNAIEYLMCLQPLLLHCMLLIGAYVYAESAVNAYTQM